MICHTNLKLTQSKKHLVFLTTKDISNLLDLSIGTDQQVSMANQINQQQHLTNTRKQQKLFLNRISLWSLSPECLLMAFRTQSQLLQSSQ